MQAGKAKLPWIAFGIGVLHGLFWDHGLYVLHYLALDPMFLLRLTIHTCHWGPP